MLLVFKFVTVFTIFNFCIGIIVNDLSYVFQSKTPSFSNNGVCPQLISLLSILLVVIVLLTLVK